MVEFALVGPILLLLLLCALDLGRGIFYYSQLAEGAREAARQAVLQYNQDSNTSPGACTSCQVPGVVPQLQRTAAFGYPVVYANSSRTSSPPAYPVGSSSTYVPAACSVSPCNQPGTITLSSAANVNTVYVFIYELDPSNGSTRWSCPSCAAASGSAVRNPGHQRVVVDLKFT